MMVEALSVEVIYCQVWAIVHSAAGLRFWIGLRKNEKVGLEFIVTSFFRMLASLGSPDLVLRIEDMTVGVMILKQVTFLVPVPHCTAALDVEAFHGLGQIDLATVVLSFDFVLDLLEHLAYCCLDIFLCHQACAKLLRYYQRKRHA